MGVATVLGTTGAATVLLGAGTASAEPASLTQKYACAFPLIGADPIDIEITSDIPATVAVGDFSGKLKINSVTGVSKKAAQALTLVGVKTLEGVATAEASVNLPGGGRLHVEVDNTVAKTQLPNPAAAFDVTAKGEAPSIGFDQTGKASIDVNALTLKLTARDAAGKPVQLPPYGDVFEAKCTLDPADQNKTLHTFTVTEEGSGDPTAGTTGSPTTAGPTTAGPTGSTSGNDTGSGGSPGGDGGSGASPQSTGGGSGDTDSTGSAGSSGSTGSGGAPDGDAASDGTQLSTSVKPGDDDDGVLATTGTSAVGLLLTGAGALGGGGIAACHYLPRRIRGDGTAA
ncbi:hypothetical protein LHJ74_21315 [Streptomyces sp. N2-109]|uniref:DUF6801 domain-containing protein n=1 Tax=Streptomyces gossypii TaxID=2883101 RepID=A0ABT2JXM0_9ACTN|nr:DUF6801 domain-containing protein [Streptomyces gossypii]MCT2592413.1 hypothetical protein [Streptomyces gossypii]